MKSTKKDELEREYSPLIASAERHMQNNFNKDDSNNTKNKESSHQNKIQEISIQRKKKNSETNFYKLETEEKELLSQENANDSFKMKLEKEIQNQNEREKDEFIKEKREDKSIEDHKKHLDENAHNLAKHMINSASLNRKGNIRKTSLNKPKLSSDREKLILNVNKFSSNNPEGSNPLNQNNFNSTENENDRKESKNNLDKFRSLEPDDNNSNIHRVKFNAESDNILHKMRKINSVNKTIENLKLFTKKKLSKVSKFDEMEKLNTIESDKEKNTEVTFKRSNLATRFAPLVKNSLKKKKKRRKSISHKSTNDLLKNFTEISPIGIKQKDNLNHTNVKKYDQANLDEMSSGENDSKYFHEYDLNENCKNEELTEEEKKKYFLSSKEQRKIKNKNFYQDYYDDKNNISVDKLLLNDEDNHNNYNKKISDRNLETLDISENSLFFKDDYFTKHFKLEEEKEHKKMTNKDEHVIHKRLMHYYLNPRKNSAMPKFCKISIKDKKCYEIMDYNKINSDERNRQFYDKSPCLKFRKFYSNIMERLKKYFFFVKSPWFDNLSLLIIIINTIIILYSNPLDEVNLANSTDQYFLYLFTIEMFLKILAFGFVVPPDSYFRDLWNILDFLVVVFGWIDFIIDSTSNKNSLEDIKGLNALRAFRILRPLKTIKSIKGLKRIIKTLLESMLALWDIVIVIFFFFTIFAIAGIQCWKGLFLRRCHSSIYGFPLPIDDYRNMCTYNSDCEIYNTKGERFYCSSALKNPNINTTSYDDFISAITTVFIITTMEGWADIFKYVSKTFKNDFYINEVIILIYFFIILFVGGYYLINLYLAVINFTYTEIELKNIKKHKKKSLSLYTLIIDAFDKTEKEENEDYSDNDDEELKDEVKEARKNKLKEECKIFDHNLDKFTISYESLGDIGKIRKYRSEEIYSLKRRIYDESQLALREYDEKFNMKKKGDLKHRENSDNMNNDQNIDLNNIGRKGTKKSFNKNQLNSKNRFNFFDKVHGTKVVLTEIIPLSIKKTMESFAQDLEKGNAEIEKKENLKKIREEKKKKKIEQLMHNFDDCNSLDEINSISSSESDQEKSIEKDELENKKSGISNQKTNDMEDDKKLDGINELTFSMNTSEDTSSYGYINESINEDIDAIKRKKGNKSPNNLFRNSKGIIDKDQFFKLANFEDKININEISDLNYINDLNKNQIKITKTSKFKKDSTDIINDNNIEINLDENNKDDLEKSEKMSPNNENNLIIKNTIVDKENNLNNKMLINKPNNPLILVPKHKNDILLKKKIKDFQEDFKYQKVIHDKEDLISMKKLKNKDTQYLNFLKNTEETTNKFQKISVEEIRRYEDYLEEQNSLDISKNENQHNIIVNSESNVDSLLTENQDSNKIEEIERLEEIKYLEKRRRDWETKKNAIKRIHTAEKNSGKKSTLSTIDLMERVKKLDFNFNNLDFMNKDLTDTIKSTINKKTISSNRSHTSRSKKTIANKHKNIENPLDSIEENFKYDDYLIQEKIQYMGKHFMDIGDISKENISKFYYNKFFNNEDRKFRRKKRSNSIKSNELKFPYVEDNFIYGKKPMNKEEEEEHESHKMIEKHRIKTKKFQDSYRSYMKYINFIMEKDYKIKDKFNVDYFYTDVMGKNENLVEENIIKKCKEDMEDPIKVFNRKDIDIKRNYYVKYLKVSDDEKEKDEIKNNLKFLSRNVINSMYSKTKNFRKLVEKRKKNLNKINIIGDSINPFMSKICHLKDIRSNINTHSSTHRSKSYLDNRCRDIKRDILMDIWEERKKNHNEVFNNFLDLSTKKKIHLFFEADKMRKNKDQADEEQIAKIEVETNWTHDDKKNKIEEIRNFDTETNTIKYKEWSGYHVMNWKDDEDKFPEWNKLLDKMEGTNIIIWEKEFIIKDCLNHIRYYLFLLSTNKYFELLILTMVFLNIILMLNGGNLHPPENQPTLNLLNLLFNIFFIFEFFVKFIGLGPIIYFSDGYTYLDFFIVGFAIVEISTDTSSEKNSQLHSISSQLNFLKVLRIFRVLRIAKILRKIKSFKNILKGIQNSLSAVAYNSLILFIFIIIFQLLGVSFFYENYNYTGFWSSFYVTFQLLTIENWNEILFSMNKMYYRGFSLIYLFSLIFIGNYILFNLFISILLNSFNKKNSLTEEEDTYISSLPEEFRMYEMKKRQYDKSRKRELIKIKTAKKSNTASPMNNNNLDEKQNFLDDFSSSEDEDYENDEIRDRIYNISYINYTGAKKFIKQRKLANNIFYGNECEYSLYIFPQTSQFRIFCKNLVNLRNFDYFILFIIFLSTLRLILDTFIEGNFAAVMFDFMDLFFTVIFVMEMSFKIIAMGFVLDVGSYLKDSWNQLDFIIVVFSIIDLESFIEKYLSGDHNVSSSISFIKILRLLRTLRPLRFISHNVQLKIIILSLFDSLGPLFNVLFILVVIILIFSIIGMNLFYSLYHTCYEWRINLFSPITNFEEFLNFEKTGTDADTVKINKICNDMNGIFDATPSFTFENILKSLMTSYVLAIGEGWNNIMNKYLQFSEYYGLYFIIFYLVVTNFFFNLFVGVMFTSFNEAWNKEHKKEITEDKKIERYWDFLKQIDIADPEYSQFNVNKEKQGLSKKISDFALSKTFDNIIFAIIVANMVTMGMDYEGCPTSYLEVLDAFNLLFSLIFFIEAILKIYALGPKGYFYIGWNRFDFFVVLASILDLILKFTELGTYEFLKTFQIIRVLRVLRVTRVLRLVKSLRGLEKLLQTLRWSLNALMNVLILMLLVFCIFSITGCYLFGELSPLAEDKYAYYNEYFNFTNFYYSFLLNFRCVTGENWNMIMIEVANADKENISPAISYIYFIIMIFVQYVILLNLFLLVTLQQFEDFSRKENNPIEKFAELLNNFKKAWNKHSTYADKGFRIKCSKLTQFFKEFDSDIMKVKQKKIDYLKKYTLDLGLLNDEEDYVYFQDVLYKMIKYEFGNCIDRKKNKLIARLEDKLNKSIKIKIDFFLKNTKNKNMRRSMNILNTFNPLTSHLYYKNSFNYIKVFLKKYMETQEENLYARVAGYNEEDMKFINNHYTELTQKSNRKKGGSLIYDYGFDNGIIKNFNEYNEILNSNEKQIRKIMLNGELCDLKEENENEDNDNNIIRVNLNNINDDQGILKTTPKKEETDIGDNQIHIDVKRKMN